MEPRFSQRGSTLERYTSKRENNIELREILTNMMTCLQQFNLADSDNSREVDGCVNYARKIMDKKSLDDQDMSDFRDIMYEFILKLSKDTAAKNDKVLAEHVDGICRNLGDLLVAIDFHDTEAYRSMMAAIKMVEEPEVNDELGELKFYKSRFINKISITLNAIVSMSSDEIDSVSVICKNAIGTGVFLSHYLASSKKGSKYQQFLKTIRHGLFERFVVTRVDRFAMRI